MIDFACKQFKIEEVIKCGLGLTKADYKILEFFIDNLDQYFTTEELAKHLKLNLTTIQRAVKKLFEKNLIDRRQENLSGGGYMFYYKLSNKNKVRKALTNIVNSWSEKVKSELNKW